VVVKPCFSPLILDDVKTQIHEINNNQKITFFFELVAAASMMMKEMKKLFVMIPIYSYSMILTLLMKSHKHKTILFRIMDFSLPMLVIHLVTFPIMTVWNGFLDILSSTRLLFARKDMEGHKYLARSNKGTLFNVLRLLHLIAQAHCSTWSLHCSLGSSSMPPPLIIFLSLVPYPYLRTA
jgi:hypothetical protein